MFGAAWAYVDPHGVGSNYASLGLNVLAVRAWRLEIVVDQVGEPYDIMRSHQQGSVTDKNMII